MYLIRVNGKSQLRHAVQQRKPFRHGQSYLHQQRRGFEKLNDRKEAMIIVPAYQQVLEI